MITQQALLALWYRALEEEIGISVKVNKEAKTIILNEAYEVRKINRDPELEKIIIVLPSKFPDELWFCKKAVEL